MSRPIIKKNIIEQTALELFVKNGIRETSVRDIASHSNSTEGALYRHYSSKDDMAKKLFEKILEKFSIEIEKAFELKSNSLDQKMEQIIEFIYNFYEENKIEFYFLILRFYDFPKDDELFNKNNPNDVIAKYMDKIIKEYNLKVKNLTFVISMIMGIIIQPIITHYYGRLKENPILYKKQIKDICLNILVKSSN